MPLRRQGIGFLMLVSLGPASSATPCATTTPAEMPSPTPCADGSSDTPSATTAPAEMPSPAPAGSPGANSSSMMHASKKPHVAGNLVAGMMEAGVIFAANAAGAMAKKLEDPARTRESDENPVSTTSDAGAGTTVLSQGPETSPSASLDAQTIASTTTSMERSSGLWWLWLLLGLLALCCIGVALAACLAATLQGVASKKKGKKREAVIRAQHPNTQSQHHHHHHLPAEQMELLPTVPPFMGPMLPPTGPPMGPPMGPPAGGYPMEPIMETYPMMLPVAHQAPVVVGESVPGALPVGQYIAREDGNASTLTPIDSHVVASSFGSAGGSWVGSSNGSWATSSGVGSYNMPHPSPGYTTYHHESHHHHHQHH